MCGFIQTVNHFVTVFLKSAIQTKVMIIIVTIIIKVVR